MRKMLTSFNVDVAKNTFPTFIKKTVLCEVWWDAVTGKELRCTEKESNHYYQIPLGFTPKEITPMGAALLIRAYECGLRLGITRGEDNIRKLLREAIGK